MELQTISQVSKFFSISTRTLRYYEEIGLITPVKNGDFTYRLYDQEAMARLDQIMVLRKLRIPLKQIAEILEHADARYAITVFEQNLYEMEEEIAALTTIRSMLKNLIKHLNLGSFTFTLPDDEGLLEIVDSLTVAKANLRKEQQLETLHQASGRLGKIEDRDVRIIYLPPMTVAAAYASGEGCESKAQEQISRFVKTYDLLNLKPDARNFGFDCSKDMQGVGVPSRIYEAWVSVPDDMEIPIPLIKRSFSGGLYAAHVLRSWDFTDWELLREWVNASEKYENDWGSPRWISAETLAGQGFEETLNFYNAVLHGQMKDLQLDLLFPVKEKDNGSD